MMTHIKSGKTDRACYIFEVVLIHCQEMEDYILFLLISSVLKKLMHHFLKARTNQGKGEDYIIINVSSGKPLKCITNVLRLRGKAKTTKYIH